MRSSRIYFALSLCIGAVLVMGMARLYAQEEQPERAVTEVLTTEETYSEQTYTLDDLLKNIDNFVKTPKGGISWQLFGKTQQKPYAYKDADGLDWEGVRPEFPADLQKLDGKDIVIQGYMFPLDPEEKQSLFLLGPFPVSCPFHYHVTPNLVIEVHAGSPVSFSYDPVNIGGKLELVPKDDENNVFFRLKDAKLL